MNRERTWLWLAALVAAVLPALLVDLGRRGPLSWMEGVALLSSRETWQRQQSGESGAWLTPSVNGSPRLRKPPMLVWLNLLAWTGLDPETAAPATLIHRSRLVTVALCMVMVLSVFWLGRTLRDSMMGLAAAAMVSSMLLVQQQARIASYDMHLSAWSMLAAAAGLWTMRLCADARASRLRLALGASCAGCALGLAFLSKGALAFLLSLLPMVLVCAIDRRNIATRLLVMASIALVGLILGSWWFIYVRQTHPELLGILGTEYSVPTVSPSPPQYYLKVLAWGTLPWTLWMLAGLVHPFVGFRGLERVQRLFPWMWSVTLLVVLLIPGAKEQRYLLPLMPALALLAAQVWRDHVAQSVDMATRNKIRWLTGPHWILMTAVAISIASAACGNASWIRHDWFDAPLADAWPRWAGVTVAAALILVAAMGWWSHRQSHHATAMVVMVVFSAALSWAHWSAAARAADRMQSLEAAAAQVNATVGASRLFYLRGVQPGHPSYEFLFYLRRLAPKISPTKLTRQAEPASPLTYVLGRQAEIDNRIMVDAHYQAVFSFEDEPNRRWTLWRSVP